MALPFSRSMRALDDSAYRRSLVGLIVAIVLLMAWAVWFLLARVTLYEVGQIVATTRQGTIVADFPPEVLKRIRRGQTAYLFPQDAKGETRGPFLAIVTDVTLQAREDRGVVELYPRSGMAARKDLPRNLKDEMTGQVEIEVGHISPVKLMMRASAQLFDTLPVALSPHKP